MRLLLVLLAVGRLHLVAATDEEARIYAGAPPGTRVTMAPRLQNRFAPYRGCYIHLNDGDGFEWRTDEGAIATTIAVQQPLGAQTQLTFSVFCADGTLTRLSAKIAVSKRNIHAPQFGSKTYSFNIPSDRPESSLIAVLNAKDVDPVIYNAQFSLSLHDDNANFYWLAANGSLFLNRPISVDDLYRRISATVTACDGGSPQLCSSAQVVSIPVTVSEPVNATINLATTKYQVFEWWPPHFGNPKNYKVAISMDIDGPDKRPIIVRREEFCSLGSASVHRFILNQNLVLAQAYRFSVTAADDAGETESSQQEFFVRSANDVECEGSCTSGGQPACYFNELRQLTQFLDKDGRHCHCHLGYFGRQCDQIRRCESQNVSTDHGTFAFASTAVNQSATVVCPFGPASAAVARKCQIEELSTPRWSAIDDLTSCRTKEQLLTHLNSLNSLLLGMSSLDSNLNALNTLTLSAEPIVPAAANDTQVADIFLGLFSNLMNRNFGDDSNEKLAEVRQRFGSLLTTYLENASHYDDVHFAKENLVLTSEFEPNDSLNLSPYKATIFGPPDTNLRAIFLKSDEFYPSDQKLAAPILEMFAGKANFGISVDDPLIFGLTPFGTSELANIEYTCVFYEPTDKMWSSKGMKTNDSNRRVIECSSTHLTAFSLLMEEKKESYFSFSDKKELVRYLITASYIFVTPLLTITAAVHGLCKSLNRQSASYVLVNVCFTLLVLHSAALVSAVAPLERRSWPCVAVGALIHYSLVSALCWLGAEASALKLKFMRAGEIEIKEFLIEKSLASWGLPAVLVVIGLLIDQRFYISSQEDAVFVCCPSSEHTWKTLLLVVLPVGLMCVMGAVKYALAMRALRKRVLSARTSGRRETGGARLSAQLSVSLLLVALVGVGWPLSVALLRAAALWPALVYAAVGGSQALLVFCVRCLGDADVRRASCCRQPKQAESALSLGGVFTLDPPPSVDEGAQRCSDPLLVDTNHVSADECL